MPTLPLPHRMNMNMNIETLEEYDDLLSVETDPVEIDIDGIDDVFEAANAERASLIEKLTATCNVANAAHCVGGVSQKAFWGWDFFVYSNGAAFAASIEMAFNKGHECSFSVKITSPASLEAVSEWFVTGTCEPVSAVATVFKAFEDLLLEIADDEPQSPAVQ